MRYYNRNCKYTRLRRGRAHRSRSVARGAERRRRVRGGMIDGGHGVKEKTTTV